MRETQSESRILYHLTHNGMLKWKSWIEPRLDGSVEIGSFHASGEVQLGALTLQSNLGSHTQSVKCVGVFVSQQCHSRTCSSYISIMFTEDFLWLLEEEETLV